MTNQQTITPPPELMRQWYLGAKAYPPDQIVKGAGWWVTDVATEAAQWGADQELEACCEWFANEGYGTAPDRIRMHRRPEPPSLKEQALLVLEDMSYIDSAHYNIIRRALEALPND